MTCKVDFNRKFTHTNEWREAAIRFLENGRYCPYPEGTSEEINFWEEETRRCLEGYNAPNAGYITPYHYFYLNYGMIKRVVKKKVYDVKKKKEVYRKVSGYSFPSFWDYDYYYFSAFEEALENGEFMTVIKARRRGYSYKNAAILCRGYYFIPGFSGLVIANDQNALTGDGFISKSWAFMDFIDSHTPWAKKRQKIDTKLHRRASMVVTDESGHKVEIGYKSEIMGVPIGADFNKVRGKRMDVIFYEEAGRQKYLKETWRVLTPSVIQDGVTFGIQVAFGTANSGDEAFNGLRDIFYNPDGWNCMGFNNIWDNAVIEDKCGFFVPAYTNMENEFEDTPLMDEDGNTNTEKAIEYLQFLRAPVFRNAKSQREIDLYVCEAPITVSEACIIAGGNIFPQRLLQEQLAAIRNTRELQAMKQVGMLMFDPDTKQLKWIQQQFGDILNYPLGKNDDQRGAIVIWDHPNPDLKGNAYIIGIDPYDHDEGTSLGSILVWKRTQPFEPFSDTLVAEYTGRPEISDQFYEIARRLSLYYNARIMCENMNRGIQIYFKNKNSEYFLAETPDIINTVVENSTVDRHFGVHVTKEIKLHMLGRIKDWLLTEFEDGRMNLTKIYSEPLLMELIRYTDDENVDRIMALGQVMLFRDQLARQDVRSLKEEEILGQKNFFNTPIFTQEFYEKDPSEFRPFDF